MKEPNKKKNKIKNNQWKITSQKLENLNSNEICKTNTIQKNFYKNK